MLIKNNQEFVLLLDLVCRIISPTANGYEIRTHVKNLLAIACAESSLVWRRQIGGGPARGLLGMEGETAKDLFINNLRYLWQSSRRSRWTNLMGFWGKPKDQAFFVPTIKELEVALEENDIFACAMARTQLLRFTAPLPWKLRDIATYWKTYWNTLDGAGTIEDFMKRCQECGFDDLWTKMYSQIHYLRHPRYLKLVDTISKVFLEGCETGEYWIGLDKSRKVPYYIIANRLIREMEKDFDFSLPLRKDPS